MDFIDQLKDFSNRVETLKGGILTEFVNFDVKHKKAL